MIFVCDQAQVGINQFLKATHSRYARDSRNMVSGQWYWGLFTSLIFNFVLYELFPILVVYMRLSQFSDGVRNITLVQNVNDRLVEIGAQCIHVIADNRSFCAQWCIGIRMNALVLGCLHLIAASTGLLRSSVPIDPGAVKAILSRYGTGNFWYRICCVHDIFTLSSLYLVWVIYIIVGGGNSEPHYTDD